MKPTFAIAALLLLLLAAGAPCAEAQELRWTPPAREMPPMPRMAELGGDWLGSRAAWFSGVDRLAGVALSELRAQGEPRGADVAQVARFSRGPMPVVVWSDRNGDARSDMIEIYRTGGVIVQLIDADFDGAANVIRYYDASGRLLREDRM